MANENPSETPKPDAGTTGLASAWNQLFSNQLAYRRERMGQLGEEGQSISALARSAAEPTEAIKEDRAAVSKEATRQAKEPVGVPDQPPTYQKPEKLRPFGQGTGPMNALQSVVNGLGLIIAMGVGTSKGFPQGALAAYSGALDGWAKGDEKRAQDQWRTYLQNVQEANDAWKRGMETREAMIRNNKDTLDALRIRLAIHEAEQGSKKEIVALMMKDHEQAMKLFELEGKEIDRLMKTNFDLFKFQIGADEKKRMNDNLIQHRAAMERHWEQTQNENAKGRAAARSILEQDRQMKQYVQKFDLEERFTNNLNQIEKAYRHLEKKNPDLLPQTGEVVDQWIARISKALEPGDPDVAVISQFWNPTMIGLWDRGMNDEKGARALVAFAPQLEGHTLLSPQAFRQVSGVFRGLIKQSMDNQLEVMRKLQINPGVMAAAELYRDRLKDPFDTLRETQIDSTIDYDK